MPHEFKMYGKLPFAICLFVAITLVGLAPIDAAKTTRAKTKSNAPNHDHVRLTHAVPPHSQPQHHAPSQSYAHQRQQAHVQQSHVPQTHASAPALPPQTHASAPALPPQTHASAPALPNANANNPNNRIGWNVGHSDTAQKQTVSNTNSGFQQPHAAAAPPYPQNSNGGGVQPPYPANPNFNNQNAGLQSSYPGQNVGGHNAQSYPAVHPQQQPGVYPQHQPGVYPQQQPGVYPQQHAGVYPQQQAGLYPQQQPQVPYNPNTASYPMQQQPNYGPGGGQQPVYNNFYQQQPKSGGTGSVLQTAAIAGIGGLALYGALKPSQEKTIIIHEGGANQAAPAPNAPPLTVPASPPGAAVPAESIAPPAAPVVQPAAIPSVPLAQAVPEQPATWPLGTAIESSTQPQALAPIFAVNQPTFLPNAPGPFVTPVPSNEGTVVPLASFPQPQDHQPSVSLAPLPDQSTVVSMAPLPTENMSAVAGTTTARLPLMESATAVPLAPMPNNTPTSHDAAHAPLRGVASSLIIFNMSFYTCISIVLAKLLI